MQHKEASRGSSHRPPLLSVSSLFYTIPSPCLWTLRSCVFRSLHLQMSYCVSLSHPNLKPSTFPPITPTPNAGPFPEGKTQNVSLHSNLPSVINFFTTLFQTICVQSFYFLTLPLLQKNVFRFLLSKPEANHILLIPASEARPWQHCYA